MDLTERPARPRGGSVAAYARAALLAGLVAIPFCWPMVKQMNPPDARFQFADLLVEHWAHRKQLEPWLGQRWAWLAMNGYGTWFSLAALPGVLVAGVLLAVTTRCPLALLAAPVGWCL